MSAARRLLVAVLGLGVCARGAAAADQDWARYVNPFVGTQDGGTDFGHGGGAGMNFPGAVLPFGMMQWSPDTVRLAGGGYKYEDNRIRGFSLTHISGPGCASAQDFPVLPLTGAVDVSPATNRERYAQTFKHDNEEASPGYYGVTLDSGVKVELTAGLRSGIARFRFPAGQPATLLLDVTGGGDDGEAHLRGNRVSGWVKSGGFCGTAGRYYVYFEATFDRPFRAYGSWRNASLQSGRLGSGGAQAVDLIVKGPGAGVYLQFDPDGTPLQMQAALSYVSLEGARRNGEAELAGKSFEDLRQGARAAWNEQLGQIAVSGGSESERRTFYTALYHALTQPYVFDDVDGRYTGFDFRTHDVAAGHHHFATFSGWDIYRSEMPLLAFLEPAVASDIAQSMYDDAHALGDVWDRWSHQNTITGVMNGDPYHAIVSSVYALGGRDFDAKAALAAMVKGARRIGPDVASGYEERPGNADYLTLGYVPGDVSTTLEYNLADFAIAQLAERLGEPATRGEFMRRAQGWQLLYNPANGWLQPRFSDGSFLTPFDPAASSWYVEGNGAQYHWLGTHNVAALFAAMGGRKLVLERLDSFFRELNAGSGRPFAYLGNEPSLWSPWLYVWAGAPYKTQDVVRRAQALLFKPTPDGLVGNDDLGTMSAWYVWASLGFYPVIPGRAELILHSPLFEGIEIRRGSGQHITIRAPGASTTVKYVQTLQVNGQPARRAWLPESFLGKDGTLEFVLGPKPNTSFGSAPADAPPSFGDGERALLCALDPGRAPLQPGGVLTATVLVQSAGEAGALSWTAQPPANVTVTPASGTLNVPRGGRASAALRVSIARDASFGTVSVPVGLRATDGSPAATVALQLNVARPGTIDWYANNPGVSDDARPGLSNFDGVGWSYSAPQLAAQGLEPGAAVRWRDFTFRWPGRKPGELDNVVAGGQTLELTEVPVGASRLAFLGAGANGDAHGQVTVHYADGSSTTAPLDFGDWALGGLASAAPRFGNETVATTPYRNGAGGRQPLHVYVFAAAPIPLDPGKQVKSFSLAASPEGGSLHVFAWAFAK
jgi:predicted alpha-1,2-mannosidase